MAAFVKRRALIAAGLAATAVPAGFAAAAEAPASVPLWPEGALGPGGLDGPEQVGVRGQVTGIARPRLLVHRPARPRGMAMIVIAGGGYDRVESRIEGAPSCAWLIAQGITALELIYRLPGEDWPVEATLADGQRAMRLARAHAADWGFDAARIGVLGYSAGGHLAGMMTVRAAARWREPLDAIDRLPARPALAALIYPVLSMEAPLAGTRTRRSALGDAPDPAARDAFSFEPHVRADTPPTFLVHAADDPIVRPAHSLGAAAALQAAGVPVALHLFTTGQHGFVLGREGGESAAWPGLFLQWAEDRGVLPAR